MTTYAIAIRTNDPFGLLYDLRESLVDMTFKAEIKERESFIVIGPMTTVRSIGFITELTENSSVTSYEVLEKD